jgi:hypothetical protein
MRKTLFALAMLVTGVFAFGAGTPASAMTVGSVASASDVVKSTGTVEKVHYRRYGRFCDYYPWRCRRHYGGYRYRDYGYRRHYGYRDYGYRQYGWGGGYRPYYYRPWW